jgi:hypothetical protein
VSVKKKWVRGANTPHIQIFFAKQSEGLKYVSRRSERSPPAFIPNLRSGRTPKAKLLSHPPSTQRTPGTQSTTKKFCSSWSFASLVFFGLKSD